MPDTHYHFPENFKLTLDTHFPQEKHLFEQVSLIIKNQHKIMAKQDQMDAALAEINDATNAIAARIQAFIGAGTDGITQASLDSLQADADALRDIGTPPAPTT